MLSLTDHQAASVAAVLPSLHGSWVLDRHVSYDGHLSVLLTPEEDSDEAPTYVIDRDGRGIHLRLLTAEAYQLLGTFSAIADLMPALRAAVSPENGAPEVTHAA